jgi:hypothetical protein
MSRFDKLLDRFRGKPSDFTWDEFVRLMTGLGYVEVKKGKPGCSRRRFVHPTAAIIVLHKPHPGKILKKYQIEQVFETLQRENLL